MNEEVDFDFDEILEEFRNGKKLTGKGGLLAPLIKQLTEAALEAEVESHIANDVLSGNRNRRNGVNKKTIKGTSVSVFKSPPVITWSVTIHMQEYKNDLIEMLKTNLEKQNPVKFKEAMQKLENGAIEDKIKNEQVNKIINYNCSRKDYMYLYNRGIAMRYVYKDEKYTSFGDIFIDKQACNKLGLK
jgi:hypothetical protein